MYRFELNGVEVEHPLEWESIITEIKFEKELNSISKLWPLTLTFVGGAYETLANYRNSTGICGSLTMDIYIDDVLQIEGKILMATCVFNPMQRTVQTTITDRSFYAQINNNKKIDASLGSDQGKNSVQGSEITVTNPTRITATIEFYDGMTIQSQSFYGYDLKETFQYLVEFMSDGDMGFRSDWYDGLDADEKILVTSGNNIRVGAVADHIDPVISFYNLYTDLMRAFNLVMLYERDLDGTYYLRIEDLDYITDINAVTIELNQFLEYEISVDEEELPAKISVGNTKAEGKSGSYGEIPAIRLLGSEQEEYHVQGECNIDYELDLKMSNVNTLHNDMYDIVINSSTSYDDQVFLINYNSGTNAGVKTDAFNNGNSYVYNEVFFNYKIIERYNLQGAVAYFLSGFDSGFEASGTDNSTLITVGTVAGSNPYVGNVGKLDYTTEVYDPLNAYNDTTSRFVAPSATTFNFYASYFMNWCASDFCASIPGATGINLVAWTKGSGVKFLEFEFKIVHYDATVTVVKNSVSDYYPWSKVRESTPGYDVTWSEYEKDSRCVSGAFTRSLNASFNMAIGEVVQVEGIAYLRMGVEFNYKTLEFSSSFNYTDGGVFQPVAPDSYKASIITFKDHPITDSQRDSILDYPYRPITVSHPVTGLEQKCFTRNIKINMTKNTADFELRTAKDINI